jgi:hypothetical protein
MLPTVIVIASTCVSLVVAIGLLVLLWWRESPRLAARGVYGTLTQITRLAINIWLCPISISVNLMTSTILYYLEQISHIHWILHWLVRPVYYPVCYTLLMSERGMARSLGLYMHVAFSMQDTCQSHEVAVQYCRIQ